MTLEEDFVFPVYIYNRVLNNIKNLCKSSKLEIFGYLIGNILKWKEKIYVIIEEQLYIKGAVHSDKFSTAQIEGTAGEYEQEFRKMKQLKGDDNLRIIGWWHSHPNFGCFLSLIDIHTQEFFFPESYQVALVVDPVRNEIGFFTLDNNSKNNYKNMSYAIIPP